MRVERFVEMIGSDFYTGVPDSQLKPLCDYLMNTYGIDPKHHVIGANEGNCTALAAGYHLATGKVPVVYLQNSGEGNIINPVASLLNDQVYAIPCIFIIGWRGEPGVHDEPQHIFQGDITIKLLEDMGIHAFVISPDTTDHEVQTTMVEFQKLLELGKNVAFVIRKGALTYNEKATYENSNTMVREEIIRHIMKFSGEDPIVSTTGKASRELFELRATNGQSHHYDFLTVGSMGHASSIALGVAVHKPDTKIWCIDGDGAVLMHMGALAVIGASKPKNLVHVIINNEAHETVGGMPTVSTHIDFSSIAKACGYPNAVSVSSYEQLDTELEKARDKNELSMIEARCSIGSRSNLGRPTTSAVENKQAFMKYMYIL
jgi:phosphonopyruvate decarboxylase